MVVKWSRSVASRKRAKAGARPGASAAGSSGTGMPAASHSSSSNESRITRAPSSRPAARAVLRRTLCSTTGNSWGSIERYSTVPAPRK
jgi:hypothetical protein